VQRVQCAPRRLAALGMSSGPHTLRFAGLAGPAGPTCRNSAIPPLRSQLALLCACACVAVAAACALPPAPPPLPPPAPPSSNPSTAPAPTLSELARLCDYGAAGCLPLRHRRSQVRRAAEAAVSSSEQQEWRSREDQQRPGAATGSPRSAPPPRQPARPAPACSFVRRRWQQQRRGGSGSKPRGARARPVPEGAAPTAAPRLVAQ
jgi:hypothetical protein